VTVPFPDATVYRSSWILPISRPPIRDGWIAIANGRIEACGSGEPPPAGRTAHLGRVAIMPGLVNAHAHLELSWLRGRIPSAEGGMIGWVQRMLAARRAAAADDPIAIAAGVAEARMAGTALVGDVTNTLATAPALSASGMSAVLFYELIGFNAADPERIASEAMRRAANVERGSVRATLAPHAPYSVSPALFRAIAREVDARGRVTSVHAGESPEEMAFLRDGRGGWRDVLESVGTWDSAWCAPACGPIEYLDRLGVLNDRTLLVHAVQLDASELSRAADRGATIVTCPRSNAWIGVGDPPIDRFYASRARVAVGTDSLASVADLNLFAELAAMRRLAPAVPASRLLDSATRAGAEALGFSGELGVLATGARAELIAVDVPDGIADVEEYLVAGIEPRQIRWLSDSRKALGIRHSAFGIRY
jgi:cytosine/adenosine deaminase-related metal-dependent hydrolase